ncbi:testis-specific Y-encoded protein 3-like [Rhinopithecus roxellana]|uniref:testis-specific Y-encoded protein 3-like n=1 Tax=Rhinopithecus roxellana TaxID=61622 RepID=UPI0012378CD6|nr:testis-specific Y-encoded protein 3-like [Rhinopithecus roxellana]
MTIPCCQPSGMGSFKDMALAQKPEMPYDLGLSCRPAPREGPPACGTHFPQAIPAALAPEARKFSSGSAVFRTIHLACLIKSAKHPIHFCQIMLFFRSNLYFQNKVITKEYLVNITEYRASHSTPIQWCQDYEVEAYHRRHNSSGLNFFNWFSDHNFAGSSGIAEILRKDLWRNPLQYYRRMKPPEEGTEISGDFQIFS